MVVVELGASPHRIVRWAQGYRDRLAEADLWCVIQTLGRQHRDRFTGHRIRDSEVRREQGRDGSAIALLGYQTLELDHEGTRLDVRGQPSRLGERVVGDIGAADGVARGRHRLGRTRVLGVEAAAGSSGGQRHRIVAQRRHRTARQRGHGRAVVDLVGGGHASHRHGRGADARRQASGLGKHVVGRISTADRVPRGRHRLGRTHVLGVEAAAGSSGGQRHDVARQQRDGAA